MILLLSVTLHLFEKINIENAFAEKATMDNSLFYHPIQKTAALIYPAIKDGFMELKKSSL
jgi:membrane protein required for colicin V production